MNTSASHDKGHGTIVKRVSKKGHDEAHGGAWKVAFADFVLALMCLFLVLWILAARTSEQAAEDVRRATGGKMFEDGGSLIQGMEKSRGSLIPREPVAAQSDQRQPRKAYANAETNHHASAQGLATSAEGAPRRYETAADLRVLALLIAELAAGAGLYSNLQTMITPYGLRVMLHDTDKVGMFERGNALPSERFRLLLRRLGPVFATVENQLLIVGHTDSVPYARPDGSPIAMSNWSLSNNRAMAARFHMVAGGMPSDGALQVIGMADRAPLDASRPDADLNRRIEVLVLTTEHAQAVASMFGPPGDTQALAAGIESAMPERGALQQLRDRLTAR